MPDDISHHNYVFISLMFQAFPLPLPLPPFLVFLAFLCLFLSCSLRAFRICSGRFISPSLRFFLEREAFTIAGCRRGSPVSFSRRFDISAELPSSSSLAPPAASSSYKICQVIRVKDNRTNKYLDRSTRPITCICASLLLSFHLAYLLLL